MKNKKILGRSGNMRKCRGFTLVEVLVAAVVLAAGLVAVFDVFLSSIDVIQLFDNRLNAQFFLNEKISQLQNDLNRQSGMFIPMNQSGQAKIDGRDFYWQVDLQVVDVNQELYKVNASMSWDEANKTRSISRQVLVKSFYSNANPWKKIIQ